MWGDYFFWFYRNYRRNMFGLSFNWKTLHVWYNAHGCLFLLGSGAASCKAEINQQSSSKLSWKHLCKKLLCFIDSLHHCTWWWTSLAGFRLNQLKLCQVITHQWYTIPFLITFLIKKMSGWHKVPYTQTFSTSWNNRSQCWFGWKPGILQMLMSLPGAGLESIWFWWILKIHKIYPEGNWFLKAIAQIH